MDRQDILTFPVRVAHNCQAETHRDLTEDSRCENSEGSGVLEYRTARSREDYEGAFSLLQRRYEEVGLSVVNRNSMRVMPYHLSPDSQIFVASQDDQIVGTVTLLWDGPAGLPFANSYPEAMARLKHQACRVGEITSLAIDPWALAESQIRQTILFGNLTRLLSFFARAQGLEYLAAIVHPRHAKFYERSMGFEIIGSEKRCPSVGGRPGVAVLGFNDPNRYSPRWRSYYFDGQFDADELRVRPMSERDRRFFDTIERKSIRRVA